MPEPAARSPVAEDVLAVRGHCCSARLTHLPALEEGIDFTPDAAALAVFAQQAGAPPAPPAPPAAAPE